MWRPYGDGTNGICTQEAFKCPSSILYEMRLTKFAGQDGDRRPYFCRAPRSPSCIARCTAERSRSSGSRSTTPGSSGPRALAQRWRGRRHPSSAEQVVAVDLLPHRGKARAVDACRRPERDRLGQRDGRAAVAGGGRRAGGCGRRRASWRPPVGRSARPARCQACRPAPAGNRLSQSGMVGSCRGASREAAWEPARPGMYRSMGHGATLDGAIQRRDQGSGGPFQRNCLASRTIDVQHCILILPTTPLGNPGPRRWVSFLAGNWRPMFNKLMRVAVPALVFAVTLAAPAQGQLSGGEGSSSGRAMRRSA